jgi:hypothetical protein
VGGFLINIAAVAVEFTGFAQVALGQPSGLTGPLARPILEHGSHIRLKVIMSRCLKPHQAGGACLREKTLDFPPGH